MQSEVLHSKVRSIRVKIMIKTDFYNTHGELVMLKPNQKIIEIDSTQRYKGHGTLKIHNGIWEKAYKDTKGSAAFGLYCYFASNVDNSLQLGD